MTPLKIFEIRFPYLNNGSEYLAKVFSEKEARFIRFRIFPHNRVDFRNFVVTYDMDGIWNTESDYQKQTDFFKSICSSLQPFTRTAAHLE